MDESDAATAAAAASADDLLVQARKFVLKVVRSNVVDVRYRKEVWAGVPAEWKKDSEIAFAAFKRGFIAWEDLPYELASNKAVLLQEVRNSPDLWYSLPDAFKNDLDFSRCIRSIDQNKYVFREILARFPLDPVVWSNILGVRPAPPSVVKKAPLSSFLRDMVHRNSPIFGNRALMIKLCTKDPKTLEYISAQLKQDSSFFSELFSKNPMCLFQIPHEVQLRFPDLVASFIKAGCSKAKKHSATGLIPLNSRIAPELWQNRDIAMGWFQAGGPFVRRHHSIWREDKEVFLNIAKHADEFERRESFECLGRTLRGDEKFMKQVIALDPYLSWYTDARVLQPNFEFALAAFGSKSFSYPHRPFGDYTTQDFHANCDWLAKRYRPWLQSQLELRESLVTTDIQTIRYAMENVEIFLKHFGKVSVARLTMRQIVNV